MGKLTIEGLPGLDGEYDVVQPPFMQKEWHEIKVRTGLRPAEFEEAAEKLDTDIMVAVAWVSLTRAGHHPKRVWELLWESDPLECLRFDFTDDEADASPPLEEEATLRPGPTVSPAVGVESDVSSGASTKPLSDPAANFQRRTGTLD